MDVIIIPEYESPSDDSDFEYSGYSRGKRIHYEPPRLSYKEELQKAIHYEDMDTFLQLLKNNNNNIDFDYGGWTPLMEAASFGQSEKLEYFLELGSDPNYNYDSFTAVLATCSSSKPEKELLKCLDILETHGAKLNVEDRQKMTSLMYACKHGHLSIVKRLLFKHPECINKVDSQSCSALYYAVSNNYPDVVKVLLAAKAKTNTIDIMGNTVLNIAVTKEYDEIVELLSPGYFEKLNAFVPIAGNSDESLPLYQITTFRENLPRSNIHKTGFQSYVIEMLRICQLSEIISDFVQRQTSLFEFLNMDETMFQEHNIALSYQKNEILNAVKKYNLCKFKIARSVRKKCNDESMKMDDVINYIYLICEQMYTTYSSLHYAQCQKYEINDLASKANVKPAGGLLKLSLTLSKFERLMEYTLLTQCTHPAGFIDEDRPTFHKYFLYAIFPLLGLYYFL